jgi:hypothetical protein
MTLPDVPVLHRPAEAAGDSPDWRDRLAGLGLAITIFGCTLNFPKWAFGTTPADIFTVLGILLMTIGGMVRRVRVPAGAWLGIWLMLGSGLTPMLFATGSAEAFATVLKLAYLFWWAALAAATVRRLDSHRGTMHLVGAALVLASLSVIFAPQLRRLPLLSMLISVGEYRAAGTFENPNMTAAFLFAGLVYLPWSLRPRDLLVGLPTRLIVLLAFIMSGSFGGVMALALALGWCGLGWLTRSTGPWRGTILAASALGAIGGLVLLSLVPSMALPLAPLGDAIFPGRNFRSSVMDRVNNTGSTLVIWRQSPFLGQGAGLLGQRQREEHLVGWGGHNEYATTLAERGVVGFVGLAALFAMTILRSVRGMTSGDEEDRGLFTRHLGCLLGLCAYGTSHDVIHHRILWVVFLLLWALPLCRDVDEPGE